MDLSSFYNQFREETAENIRVLNEGLLALESFPDHDHPSARERIDALFRAVHTIKGSARLLGFEAIGRLAHTMEHILGAVREGRRALNRPLADDLLRGGDAIIELTAAAIEKRPTTINVEALTMTLGRGMHIHAVNPDATFTIPEPGSSNRSQTTNDGATSTESQASPDSQGLSSTGSHTAPRTPRQPEHARRANNRQTVRVRVDRLDKLINLAGELTVGQQVLANHTQVLQEFSTLIQQQERSLAALDAELRRLRFSATQRQGLERYLNTLYDSADQASRLLDHQVEQFTEHVSRHKLLVADLEQEVIAARLLPIVTIFTNIPRAVRDLANTTGKAIRLEMSGENTELDRKLLEAMNDPLLHLVRNAVDHGIEAPDERVALGKPREGRIAVGAETLGGEVRITISDDGRGMEAQKLRETAVRKGLISAEHAAHLSDQEALELIFLPGFSTAPIITDISGRGVGMDVVRTNIGELGGQVLIESQPGQGTQIMMLLPLTLVTTRILMVQVGDSAFALPASGCRGTIWVYQKQIHAVEGQATITHESHIVPLVRLVDLLGILTPPAFPTHERLPAVLIGTNQRMVGLLVENLLDEREAVVKPLGPLLEAMCRSNSTTLPYSGAVQSGDGSLALLLNPTALILAARGVVLSSAAGAPVSANRPHLLIADDSFTTRELMRSILQSAGYTVTAAIDGLDALDKLRIQTYDLLVSDVEMPRVDGFQLTSRIRRELGNTAMPVIIMTSLASDDHRRRGLESGAQAYIVKSQFNQDNLLEVIQQLLGSEGYSA